MQSMYTIKSLSMGQREGFDLRAEIVADEDTRPTDFDCYDPKDVESFERGDWQFVGVIVVASRNGHDLADASLWGVDYGLAPSGSEPATEWSYAEWDIPEDLASEAIAAAWKRIEEERMSDNLDKQFQAACSEYDRLTAAGEDASQVLATMEALNDAMNRRDWAKLIREEQRVR